MTQFTTGTLKSVLFISLLLVVCQSVSSQITVQMREAQPNNRKMTGFSEGEKRIQFTNTKLFDILTKLSGINKEEFEFNGSVKNPTVHLTITSNEKLQDQNALEQVILECKKQFDIEITPKSIQKEVYVLTGDFLNSPDCDSSNTYDQISQINNKWKGNCVGLSKVRDQILKWYGKTIYYKEKLLVKRYNLEMEYMKSWESFKAELQDKYALRISKRTKTIETLSLRQR